MSVIGYVRERGTQRAELVAQLQARGCTSVHFETESGDEGAVLRAVVRFLRAHDRLVVNSLRELGASPAMVLDMLEGASAKRAVVEVLGCGLSTAALKVALAGLDELPEEGAALVPPKVSAEAILELKAEGLAVRDIAERLGVSRVTVWRRLREANA